MTAARSRELCVMACVFCKSADFQAWLAQHSDLQAARPSVTEDEAKACILAVCQVASRNELDTDPAAAARFHQLVRLPFLAWKAEQEGAPC